MIDLGVAMRRRAWFILFSVWCSASPAWGMRAHEFIDADQRVNVTLPQPHATPAIAVEPQRASALDEAWLPAPVREQTSADDKPVVSPVPEPSGYAMLGLGLLLLVLMPSSIQQQGEMIAPDPDKPSTL